MKKTLMIAHRGYSQFEKENTLVSFTAAGAQKEFWGIETDVHVSKDNHFVIMHDENTLRITDNKVDLNIEQANYEDIAKVCLPDVDGSFNRTDIRIPEMVEYFKICKKYNKVAVLELKQVFTKKQIKEIVKIIKDMKMFKKTVFISFILEDLIILREISKSANAQWLLCVYDEKHIETLKKYNLDVDVNWPTIDENGIKKCHDNGIKVNVWTINDQEVANKYASWGVDFITSNWVKKVKIK